MKFIGFVVLCMTFWAGNNAAQSADLPEFDLRAAVYADDIDRVEAGLVAAQAAFIRGEASADGMRRLFQDFTTTNPQVIGFTKRWLEKYPQSAYANTAQAWIYFRAGWIVRGYKYARETHPEAMRQHSLLHAKAMNHARAAFYLDDQLVPASDAIIRLGNTTFETEWAIEILDHVMRSRPNYGSLYRALELTNTGYGGTADLADALCEFYGPMIPQGGGAPDAPEIDFAQHCKIEAAFNYHRSERREWLARAMAQSTFEGFDYIRISRAIQQRTRPEDAEFARAYFENTASTDIRLARNYDIWVAGRYGYDFVAPTVIDAARAQALRALEHDPYDPDLIATLEISPETVTRDENGAQVVTYHDRPGKAALRDYARRRLIVAPYDPENWRKYIETAPETPVEEAFFANESARINRIAYSQHDFQVIFGYMTRKLGELDVMQQIREQGVADGWDILLAQTDVEAQITCPLLRAKRVYDAVIEAMGKPLGYQIPVLMLVRLEAMAQLAKDEGRCENVLDARIEALFFEPVQVNLEQ